jgi:hypothetical protein
VAVEDLGSGSDRFQVLGASRAGPALVDTGLRLADPSFKPNPGRLNRFLYPHQEIQPDQS